MCKEKRKKYYQLMSGITLIIMFAMIGGLIVSVITQFKENAKAWPIIASFLNMLATLTLGSAFANLFYSHSILVEKEEDACDIDIDD